MLDLAITLRNILIISGILTELIKKKFNCSNSEGRYVSWFLFVSVYQTHYLYSKTFSQQCDWENISQHNWQLFNSIFGFALKMGCFKFLELHGLIKASYFRRLECNTNNECLKAFHSAYFFFDKKLQTICLRTSFFV